MSFTWHRQTRTFQLDGTFNLNNLEEITTPYFAHSTDELFYARNIFQIPTGHDSATYRFESTNLDGSGVPGTNLSFTERRYRWEDISGETYETLEERSGACHYDENGDCIIDTSSPWKNISTTPTSVDDSRGGTLTIDFFIINKDKMVGSGATSRQVYFRYYEDDIEIATSYQIVGEYDVRQMVLTELTAECPSDPKAGDIHLIGNFITLPRPGESSLFPDGWVPNTPVYNIDITSNTGPVDPVTGSAIGSVGAPTEDGLVAIVSSLWDGINSENKFSRMSAKLDAQAIAEVDGPGNTYITGLGIIPCFAGCPKGANLIKILLPILSGGAFGCLSCIYRSFDACREPQSMGYGWSSASSARVTEMPSGDLVYRSESGSILRWTLSGSDYVSVHTDNYVDIQKNLGSTTARYVLTTKSHSIMRFDEFGKLTETEDINGNKMSYVYDSNDHLIELSDDRGRTLYYTNRSDGQIESIRALNPTTGRQMLFEYYSPSDPIAPDRLKKITDPEGNVTEFEYNEEALLSKKTEIRASIGNHITEYEYGSDNRLAQETVNGELRTSYSYSSNFESGGTSEHTMTVQVVDLNLAEEERYNPPLRTTSYYHDTEGNLFRIVEGVEVFLPVE